MNWQKMFIQLLETSQRWKFFLKKTSISDKKWKKKKRTEAKKCILRKEYYHEKNERDRGKHESEKSENEMNMKQRKKVEGRRVTEK